MIPTLRVIGDVHAQIERADLFTRDARPYLEIIAQAPYSVQLGDMGDRGTYEQLVWQADDAAWKVNVEAHRRTLRKRSACGVCWRLRLHTGAWEGQSCGG